MKEMTKELAVTVSAVSDAAAVQAMQAHVRRQKLLERERQEAAERLGRIRQQMGGVVVSSNRGVKTVMVR